PGVMTGTGTQSDPYIIQNINDLYSMATVGGSDKYFKLGADISYDATQYANDFVPITLNCAEFDGNDHTIANASAYSASGNVSFFKVVCSTTVKYLNVENLILNSDVPSIFATESSSTFTISLSSCSR
ncbi:MAG: hypothetical protein IJM44_05865, partial [Ruminococcus sp.]|nr:hypothetical protein [Ruminococcus sp.]